MKIYSDIVIKTLTESGWYPERNVFAHLLLANEKNIFPAGKRETSMLNLSLQIRPMKK